MEDPGFGWPGPGRAYSGEFGPIDMDVYRAAGEVWPNVEELSRATHFDRWRHYGLAPFATEYRARDQPECSSACCPGARRLTSEIGDRGAGR